MIIILDEASEMTKEELDECVKFVEEMKSIKVNYIKNQKGDKQWK